MATQRQVDANRRNAQLSTGPRTEEGKERSRRNALKHGLSGAGIVMPEEEEAVVLERISAWQTALEPRNSHEEWLTALAATESIRIDNGQQQDLVLRGLQVNRAQLCWDDDRRLAAEELALRLPFSPTVVARQLRQTTQGCDCMIERWEHLAELLETHGSWTVVQHSLALDLLGTAPALRDNNTRLDPSRPDACLAVAREQITLLRQRKQELLDPLDEQERSAAELGLANEPSRLLLLARRYLGASLRRLQWACGQLQLARPDRASAIRRMRPALAAAFSDPGGAGDFPAPARFEPDPQVRARLLAILKQAHQAHLAQHGASRSEASPSPIVPQEAEAIPTEPAVPPAAKVEAEVVKPEAVSPVAEVAEPEAVQSPEVTSPEVETAASTPVEAQPVPKPKSALTLKDEARKAVRRGRGEETLRKLIAQAAAQYPQPEPPPTGVTLREWLEHHAATGSPEKRRAMESELRRLEKDQ